MTLPQSISTFISRLAVSLVAVAIGGSAVAQSRLFAIEKDSIPMFNGIAVSADLAGPVVLAVSDYGEYEAAVRVNLHNQYFPIVEVGYGKAEHDDEATGLYYKTAAPYFRVGCDLNILRNKATSNRFYVGLRYAYTSYKVDISREGTVDPVWGGTASFDVRGDKCNQHWAEVVLGLDTKIFGPLHLGWCVRYKTRLAHTDSSIGNVWYVPGFGKTGSTRIGANFNVIVEL